ncbi:MAG TPA: Zn-dependent hydrolase [Ancylobacter sp.]
MSEPRFSQSGAALQFHTLLADFARFGATAAGGVHRLCGSAEDGAARRHLATWLTAHGATVTVDAVGNMFGIFPLAGEGAPLVMAGSHLDSQPKGGRFDGTAGVAAAACAALTLMEARRSGARFNANLCVVNWTNEEGARFRPSILGSGTYAGHFTADFALSRTDDDGISLSDALEAIGFRGTEPAPPMPLAYLELHIEQGASLEQAGAAIGVVTRNWGATKVEAAFVGEQAHTGPCPMDQRRDALLAAGHVIVGVRALADRFPGVLYSSIGRMKIEPNSANVVPARTELSIELRSLVDAVLETASAELHGLLAKAAELAGVKLQRLGESRRGIRTLPPAIGALVMESAARAGLTSMPVDTVAGHDALSLIGLCPVGLMFVPSAGGISHNEAEYTSPRDLEAGLAVMTDVLSNLCREGAVPEAFLLERASA